jgi:quercetin dioxygenase-like cupin family protein
MSTSSDPGRLRPHPDARFAGAEHVLDLARSAETLRGEPHRATRGHRQTALFARDPVTMALFTFDAGAELDEHVANGLVTIHLIEGELTVRTAENTHALGPNHVVVLDPGVRHSVHATRPSTMLLTVHRQTSAQS